MKKLLWTLLLIPFFAFKCKKDGYGRIEGKIVRISCASFVVQLTQEKSTGQDGWKDILDNKKEYNDVITASNKCQIPANLKAGDIISFRITSPYTHNDCYLCTLYDAPPTVLYEIKDIKVSN
jgi:hypothetical protein